MHLQFQWTDFVFFASIVRDGILGKYWGVTDFLFQVRKMIPFVLGSTIPGRKKKFEYRVVGGRVRGTRSSWLVGGQESVWCTIGWGGVNLIRQGNRTLWKKGWRWVGTSRLCKLRSCLGKEWGVTSEAGVWKTCEPFMKSMRVCVTLITTCANSRNVLFRVQKE